LGGWWILLALFVVGVVVAAGIAAFGAHVFSGRGSSTASPTNRPSISRVPRTNTRASPPAPSASATAPAGAQVTISGIGQHKTVACNNNAVNVSGVSNTIVISGHCASLTVSGVKNMITVDTADAIEASGFNNQITYHSGAPTVSNVGDSNVVQQG
jgi:hypothetical protein